MQLRAGLRPVVKKEDISDTDQACSATGRNEIAQTAFCVETDQAKEMTQTLSLQGVANVMLRTKAVSFVAAREFKKRGTQPSLFLPDDVCHVTPPIPPVASPFMPPVVPQMPPPPEKTAEEHEAARQKKIKDSEKLQQQKAETAIYLKTNLEQNGPKFKKTRSYGSDCTSEEDFPSEEETGVGETSVGETIVGETIVGETSVGETNESDVTRAAEEVYNQFVQTQEGAHNPSRNASTSSSKREMLDQISDRPIIID